MTTGRDIVTQAYLKAGITGRGISPSAANMQDGLADLNDLLSEWRQQGFMSWSKMSTGFVSDGRYTGGYTVGPTGEYAMTPRPNRLYGAFVRQLQDVGGNGNNEVDQPLHVIDAREEYDRISLKTLVAYPQSVFLDTSLPQALLKIYPWPTADMYAVYITTRNTIPVVTLDLVLDEIFPDGYASAMKFNLARRLRQAHGRGFNPDQELNRLANNSLDVVMQSNAQFPEMVMPIGLIGRGSGYNIYSDQFGT